MSEIPVAESYEQAVGYSGDARTIQANRWFAEVHSSRANFATRSPFLAAKRCKNS